MFWVVSHCDTSRGSNRELYVQNLKRFLPVDIFGDCGSPFEDKGDWFGKMANSYKFYLAFENSLCTEYITEKFWRSLRKNMQFPTLSSFSKLTQLNLKCSKTKLIIHHICCSVSI